MTPAEVREARSALRSAYTLLRFTCAEDSHHLIDCLEAHHESCIDYIAAAEVLLDVSDTRAAVMRGAEALVPGTRHLSAVPDTLEGIFPQSLKAPPEGVA